MPIFINDYKIDSMEFGWAIEDLNKSLDRIFTVCLRVHNMNENQDNKCTSFYVCKSKSFYPSSSRTLRL